MDIFDKISDAVVSAGKQVSDRTKEVSDIAKMRYEMRTEQNAVDRKFQELGEKYYEANKDKADIEEADLFEEIKASLEKINSLSDSIMDATGSVACPECGAKIKAGAKFCSECGAKLETPEDAFEEEEAEEKTTED